MTAPSIVPAPMAPRAWAVALLFVLVLAARVAWVALYAASVPFWDQWDAEAAYLLKPWVEGTWSPLQLLSAHNEHRIAWSRLLSLALFEANGGQWDNLVSALANTVLAAALAALVFRWLGAGLDSAGRRAGFFVAVLALAVLPFGWENTVVGFQSQFQFLVAFALLTLAAASRAADRPAAMAGVAALALLGLFTMASGVLAPVAAAAVLLVRAWLGQLRWRVAVAGMAVLAAIAVGGYLAVPVLAGHQGLKAADASHLLRALAAVLAWPRPASAAGVVLLWLPCAWFGVQLLRRRQASRADLLAGGLAVWALLQCLAVAYSRGQDLLVPPSRYTDLLAVGVLVNAWFALRALPAAAGAPPGGRAATLAMAVLFTAAVAQGLVRSWPNDLAGLGERARLSDIQAARVRSFVIGGDPDALQAPLLHIPYPDPARLQRLLSEPAVRDALPWTLREPLVLATVELAGAFAAIPGHGEGPAGFLSCAAPRCAAGEGQLVATGRARGPAWLYLPTATGGETAWLGVSVAESDRAPVPETLPEPGGHSLTGSPFRILARDASPAGWLAVGAPVEIGRLSRWAASLQAALRRGLGSPGGPAPGAGVAVFLAVAEGAPQSQALPAGSVASGRFRAPQSGLLIGATLPLEPPLPAGPGTVPLRLCTPSACANASARADAAPGRPGFAWTLDRPLPVVAGQVLRYRLRPGQGADVPGVVTWPARPGTASWRLHTPGATAVAPVERLPALALVYLR